jgi:hypothetical protein
VAEIVNAVTLTSSRYDHTMDEFLFPHLRYRDIEYSSCWFQQEAATVHTSRQSKDNLTITFEHRLISRYGAIPYSVHSSDFLPCDFFWA